MSTQTEQQPRTDTDTAPAALVLVRNDGDLAPAASASGRAAVLNPATIAQIKVLDAEATALLDEARKKKEEARQKREEAEGIRKQAAALIVELLAAGASQRQVADALGCSRSHICFAATAWGICQDETLRITSFNQAYKLAQRPATRAAAIEAAKHPDAIEAPAGQAPAPAGDAPAPGKTESEPFVPWTKRVQTVRSMVPEMIAQADLQQARTLARHLDRLRRELATRIKELESVPSPA